MLQDNATLLTFSVEVVVVVGSMVVVVVMGVCVGSGVNGVMVGIWVGGLVEAPVGLWVGDLVGLVVGTLEGALDGEKLGCSEGGLFVGISEGPSVSNNSCVDGVDAGFGVLKIFVESLLLLSSVCEGVGFRVLGEVVGSWLGEVGVPLGFGEEDVSKAVVGVSV
jgi:hypothetical protein